MTKIEQKLQYTANLVQGFAKDLIYYKKIIQLKKEESIFSVVQKSVSYVDSSVIFIAMYY